MPVFDSGHPYLRRGGDPSLVNESVPGRDSDWCTVDEVFEDQTHSDSDERGSEGPADDADDDADDDAGGSPGGSGDDEDVTHPPTGSPSEEVSGAHI